MKHHPSTSAHAGPFANRASALRRTIRREWPLVGIVVAALVLRSYQLLDQVPIYDEWYALHAAMTYRISYILTHFGGADVSIPIAVYYKLLLATVGLNTWELRAPFLLFGLATVVGFPLMVRPFVGRPASNVLAALLATSPILVFYSRWARPYAIALFCALGAAIAFRAWWRSGRTRWAVAYVALAAASCWLLLLVAPFVLGSFLLCGAAALRLAGDRIAALKRMVGLGLMTAAVLAVLIGPAIYFDVGSLLLKAGSQVILPEHLYQGVVQALGNGEPVIALGVGALAALGIVVLFRREPQTAGHFTGLAILQVGSFVVARPSAGGWSVVSARYMLPVLAVLLMFAAIGVTVLGDIFGRVAARWLRPSLAALVCCCMLWWSSIPLIVARPNAWASQYLEDSADWYRSSYRRNVRRIPKFYATLASKPPGSTPVVEAAGIELTFLSPLAFYQRVARQPTWIGMHNGLCGPPTFGEVPFQHRTDVNLRTHLFLGDIQGMRRRGVQYVILHRDLYRELRRPPTWVGPSADLQPCIDWLRTQLGAPVFEDGDIVVFELWHD